MIKTLRGTPKHLSRTGQLEGFTYLMLSLPFRCNYRCLKCFSPRYDDQAAIAGQPITLDEILSVIKEAKILGGKEVVFAGDGEPVLDPNFRSIVLRVEELGMISILYTNGSTLEPGIASFCRQHDVCLVVALDSLKPEVYSLLTGREPTMLGRVLRPDNLRRLYLGRVLRNLNNLRRLYADTAEEKDGLRVLRLALNMTVCSRNKGEIEEIKAFAGDDMHFLCNPLLVRGRAADNKAALVDSEEELAEYQQLAQRHSETGGPLTLDRTGLCGYSTNGIGIGPFGHYMTCAYTTQTNGLLGTVRDRSLAEAYEFKNQAERKHYQKYGPAPCLVRMETFGKFVQTLCV